MLCQVNIFNSNGSLGLKIGLDKLEFLTSTKILAYLIFGFKIKFFFRRKRKSNISEKLHISLKFLEIRNIYRLTW